MHYSSRKYKRLIQWIADNDNPGDHEPIEEIKGYLTVVMVAHCFDLKAEQVAEDVCMQRTQEAHP